MIAYFEGRFLPKQDVHISPDDRGFLFADGVYDVMRSYDGHLFKLDDHLRRLERSLQQVRIAAVDVEHLKEIAEELLERNELKTGDGSVYLQITRGTAPRKHSFPTEPVNPTVYLSASPSPGAPEEYQTGAKVILVPDIRWARCDIKSTALLPNVLANQQAKESGALEALFVRDGTITEGTHTNVCAVFGGELFTSPKSNYILSGITRDVVLGLCRDLKITTNEFPVFEHQLKDADELFILSTNLEIIPIVVVDDAPLGSGKPGPVARRLQKAFRETVHSAS